ncbi:MAG: hypothetical protein RL885_31410 [Planctomycetota bacterium]
MGDLLQEIGFLGWLSILAGLGIFGWSLLHLLKGTLPLVTGLWLGIVPFGLGILGAGLRFQTVQIELQKEGKAWTGITTEERADYIDSFWTNVWVGVVFSLLALLPVIIQKLRASRRAAE